MAETSKPTNENIVKMLDQILHQLGNVRSSQQQLAAAVRKVAKTTEQ